MTSACAPGKNPARAGAFHRLGDEEAATARASLAYQPEARSGVLGALDHDVLQQVAEAGFNRALRAAGFDLEIIGDRALLVDLAVGLDQNRARRVAVSGTGGVELLERLQAGFDAGEFVLARTDRTGPPLVLDARAGELGFPGRLLAIRVDSIKSWARRRPSDAAVRSAATRSDSIRESLISTSSLESVSPTRSRAAAACSSA